MTALRSWGWKKTPTNSRVRVTCPTTCTRPRTCHPTPSPTTTSSPILPRRTSWCPPWIPNLTTWTTPWTRCRCRRIYRYPCPKLCLPSTPCPNLSQKASQNSSHNLRGKWKCHKSQKTMWFRWSTNTLKRKLLKSRWKDAKSWKLNCCIPYCPNWSNKKTKWSAYGTTWLQTLGNRSTALTWNTLKEFWDISEKFTPNNLSKSIEMGIKVL